MQSGISHVILLASEFYCFDSRTAVTHVVELDFQCLELHLLLLLLPILHSNNLFHRSPDSTIPLNMSDLSRKELQKGLDTLPKELHDMIAGYVLSNPNLTKWNLFPAQLKINRKTRAHHLAILGSGDVEDNIIVQFQDYTDPILRACRLSSSDCHCERSDLFRAILSHYRIVQGR